MNDMPIEGKVVSKDVLHLRLHLADGTFKFPDGTEAKWSLSINMDSKCFFMDIKSPEGKPTGKVQYNTEDMLVDACKVLEREKNRKE